MSAGDSQWTVQVPVTFYRNRFPNPNTDQPGDATFPDTVLLVSYSHH